jgi:hypothetical protein
MRRNRRNEAGGAVTLPLSQEEGSQLSQFEGYRNTFSLDFVRHKLVAKFLSGPTKLTGPQTLSTSGNLSAHSFSFILTQI